MAIRGSSTVVSLDLSPLGVTGPITDDGVKLLAQALRSSSSLTELTLSWDPNSDELDPKSCELTPNSDELGPPNSDELDPQS
eukprot:gene4656-14852_t